jgi:hypothetical protein
VRRLNAAFGQQLTRCAQQVRHATLQMKPEREVGKTKAGVEPPHSKVFN